MRSADVLFLWLITASPAISLSLWIYIRLFMPRHIDLNGGRRRATVAAVAATAWLANFFVPVCFGDGATYDIRLTYGLLRYHQGALPPHICLQEIHHYEFTDGFAFDAVEPMSYSTPSCLGTWYGIWPIMLLPMYRRAPRWFAAQVPVWPLFALPIAGWLVERRRVHRRLKLNLCLHCQYNLTGIRERCPECGTEIAAPVRKRRLRA